MNAFHKVFISAFFQLTKMQFLFSTFVSECTIHKYIYISAKKSDKNHGEKMKDRVMCCIIMRKSAALL